MAVTPPPPPSYTNTPEGRASYLQKFAGNSWYNEPLFNNYLVTHPDWTDNTPYWDKRLGDAPGTGSNAPSAPTRNAYLEGPLHSRSPMDDMASAVPPTSDLMSKIMAELEAQRTGDDSPFTRNVHQQMLRKPSRSQVL